MILISLQTFALKPTSEGMSAKLGGSAGLRPSRWALKVRNLRKGCPRLLVLEAVQDSLE